jgi:Predicted membrane protein
MGNDITKRLFRRLFNRQFRPSDVAQQVVGGFLLAGPFVVTEEVWVLAGTMNNLQWAVVVAIVFAIGYGALYRADSGRDVEDETEVRGRAVPVRDADAGLVRLGPDAGVQLRRA